MTQSPQNQDAETIVERRIANLKDRERFLALVREAMAKSVHHDDPLPEVGLKDRRGELTQESPRPIRVEPPHEPER